MALPVWKAKGTFTSGAAALSVPWPTSGTYSIGDIAFLAIHSANENIATPSGWTQVANSPQSTGTAAAAGGVRLAVFWKYATNTTEANVSVADSGSITAAQIHIVDNAHSSVPIHLTAGSVQTATTAMSFPGLTTTIPDCLIIQFCAQDTDAASTATSGTPTNASLASLTERHDQTVTTGAGGGLVILTGAKSEAGVVSTTTSTGSTSVTHAYITVAVAPTSDVGVDLTGESYTYTQGNETLGVAIAETGQTIDISLGIISQETTDVTLGLIGQSYSYSSSNVTTSQLNIKVYWVELSIPEAGLGDPSGAALVGSNIATTTGNIQRSDIYTLAGQNTSVISNGLTHGESFPTTGISAPVAIGDISKLSTIQLVGVSDTFETGNLSYSGDAAVNVTLTGYTVTFNTGNIPSSVSAVTTQTSFTLSQGALSESSSFGASGQYIPVSLGNVLTARALEVSSSVITVAQTDIAPANSNVSVALSGHAMIVEQNTLSIAALRQLTSQIVNVVSEVLSSINGRYIVNNQLVYSVTNLGVNRTVAVEYVQLLLTLGQISSNIAASPTTISGEARQMLADIWARLQLDTSTPVVDTGDMITVGGIAIAVASSTNATVYSRVDNTHVAIGNEEQRILEIYKRLGLNSSTPLVEESNKATVDNIQIVMTEANGSVTSQRQL